MARAPKTSYTVSRVHYKNKILSRPNEKMENKKKQRGKCRCSVLFVTISLHVNSMKSKSTQQATRNHVRDEKEQQNSENKGNTHTQATMLTGSW